MKVTEFGTDCASRRTEYRLVRRTMVKCAVLGIVCVFPFQANSAVIGTTGNIDPISPPISVGRNVLESNSVARLFMERMNLLLGANAPVDVTTTALVDAIVDLTPGQIPANTIIDSYLIHVDPIAAGSGAPMFQGSVTFSTPILGAIVTATTLTATDGPLGAISTAYDPTSVYRGFEGPGFPASGSPVNDSLQISADFRTVSFKLGATSEYDQIRVVTAAVPEPGAIALLVPLIALTLRRKHRRNPSGLPLPHSALAPS